MDGKPRIGLWFGNGLENALAARAALGHLQVERPNADWVLFGPRESLHVFEMDNRVSGYIPLRSFESRRAAQSRLSFYLEKRNQFKKLRGLQLDDCIAVAVCSGDERADQLTAKEFQKDFSRLGVGGRCLLKPLEWFLAIERPTLQAGPTALAFATQHHRKSPPNLPKYLVLLSEYEETNMTLEQQWVRVQACENLRRNVHLTIAAIVTGNRLNARQVAKSHPDWLQINKAQAMGLIAYADGVISVSGDITLICQEMGREALLLLGKSDS